MATGLIFKSNNQANSNIRLVWSGTNLLPRTSHTAIWKANYIQQTGYYALTWHSWNDGSWHSSFYEYGAHPYPCDGTYNPVSGNSGDANFGVGTHYYEIAGLSGGDFLATPDPSGVGNPVLICTKNVWVTQARTAEVIGGTTVRHTFYPDIIGHPSMSIIQECPLASIPSPGNPAFYFGASDWTSSGTAASETPSCTLRGIALFNAALSLSDITTEAASDSNSPQTSAGAASVWYINKNPTPTDISDKSTAGHNPSYANTNRPTLYSDGSNAALTGSGSLTAASIGVFSSILTSIGSGSLTANGRSVGLMAGSFAGLGSLVGSGSFSSATAASWTSSIAINNTNTLVPDGFYTAYIYPTDIDSAVSGSAIRKQTINLVNQQFSIQTAAPESGVIMLVDETSTPKRVYFETYTST